LSHCDLGCAGYPFTVRWHSELSNAVEGFWNPVSIESVAPEAIEMFGLVWTGRRDEFCIERMSFCGELFQCFAHGHDVVKRTGAEQRLGARIVNYADDLVICCKGNNAVQALETMRRMMGQLKLTVNEEKTRTCRLPEEEFDFLGYTFGRRYAAKTRRPYLAAWPSRKSIRRMTEAVHIQTGRSMEWMDAGEMVKCLNQKLGGWANYFKLGPITKAYRFLDKYTTTRLRRWLCKKHKQSGGSKRYPDEFFYQQMGLIRLPQLPQSLPWAKA
jgi:RNA-directed DNA polymerase